MFIDKCRSEYLIIGINRSDHINRTQYLKALGRNNGMNLIITSLTSPNRHSSASASRRLLRSFIVIVYSLLINDSPGNFRARDRDAAMARDVIGDATRVLLPLQCWGDASWVMESSLVNTRLTSQRRLNRNLKIHKNTDKMYWLRMDFKDFFLFSYLFIIFAFNTFAFIGVNLML